MKLRSSQKYKLLGEILLEKKLITPEQLQQALNIQKENGRLLGEILVDEGIVSEEEIAQCLAAQYGFPYLPLENYEIPASVIGLVPKQLVTKYYLIPVDRIANTLSVTMANPLLKEAEQEIKEHTGLKVRIFISTISAIRQAMEKYYPKS